VGAGLIRVGTAGWALPRELRPAFGTEGSALARYATRLDAAEINSSFHRPHAPWVYERWAASVPPNFRFSVKVPKAITHERKLVACEEPLRAFLGQITALGDRLGCLLVQLPPSLAYAPHEATDFLEMLRGLHPEGAIAFEPRHASWFGSEADGLLQELRIARVLADPVLHDAGRAPGGWPQLVYLRLHGTPRTYYSTYEPPLLDALAQRLLRAAGDEAREAWCIFDNTASGAATANALQLRDRLAQT
jgi:uncharacterized protein YecE (DUF72 family)